MEDTKVIDFVKDYVKEHPTLMQAYVQTGAKVVNLTLLSLNAFAQHLVSLQGHNVQELDAESLELQKELILAFNDQKIADGFDGDYSFGWAHKYITKIGEIKKKLGFLNFDTSINNTMDNIPKDLDFPIGKTLTISVSSDISEDDGAVMDKAYNNKKTRSYSATEVLGAPARGNIGVGRAIKSGKPETVSFDKIEDKSRGDFGAMSKEQQELEDKLFADLQKCCSIEEATRVSKKTEDWNKTAGEGFSYFSRGKVKEEEDVPSRTLDKSDCSEIIELEKELGITLNEGTKIAVKNAIKYNETAIEVDKVPLKSVAEAYNRGTNPLVFATKNDVKFDAMSSDDLEEVAKSLEAALDKQSMTMNVELSLEGIELAIDKLNEKAEVLKKEQSQLTNELSDALGITSGLMKMDVCRDIMKPVYMDDIPGRQIIRDGKDNEIDDSAVDTAISEQARVSEASDNLFNEKELVEPIREKLFDKIKKLLGSYGEY